MFLSSYIQFNQPPYQDVLESKYLDDNQLTVCFRLNDVDYVIDLSSMTQTNLVTKETVSVRRRPLYCVPEDLSGDIRSRWLYYVVTLA